MGWNIRRTSATSEAVAVEASAPQSPAGTAPASRRTADDSVPRRRSVQRLTQLGKSAWAAGSKPFATLRTPTAAQTNPSTQRQAHAENLAPMHPNLLYVLPPIEGPTLLAQVHASAVQHEALGSTTLRATNLLDPTLVRLLMQRDTLKTESAEDLVAAPVERAFDSILADETICNMAAKLRAPFGTLQAHLANLLDAATPARRASWLHKFVEVLRVEYPRPWSVKTPITGLLCGADASMDTKYAAVMKFLAQPPSDGFETLASFTIVRSFYMAAEHAGFASSTVPFATTAANRYVRTLLEQTGRRPVEWGNGLPKHQGAGITAYGEPSPICATWMQPATLACHRYEPDLHNPHVLHALANGNPYGVGISGTTNIFLHAVASVNAAGGPQAEALALTTALAAMLCYDGGHSLHETLEAAATFPALAVLNLGALRTYKAGHARAIYAKLVDPQDTWLVKRSLRRLAEFVLKAPPAR